MVMEQTIRSNQHVFVLLNSWHPFCLLKHISEIILIRFIRPDVLCCEDRGKLEAMLELGAGVHKGVVIHVGEYDEVVVLRELLKGGYGIWERGPIRDRGGKRFGFFVGYIDF